MRSKCVCVCAVNLLKINMIGLYWQFKNVVGSKGITIIFVFVEKIKQTSQSKLSFSLLKLTLKHYQKGYIKNSPTLPLKKLSKLLEGLF